MVGSKIPSELNIRASLNVLEFTPPTELTVAASCYSSMLAHSYSCYPLESCGILAGNHNVAIVHYPVFNILKSAVAYEMDPKEQIEIMLQIEEMNREMLAIYHSHPHGPAIPSITDVDRAYYPETAQIIISHEDRDSPIVRAFSIFDRQVEEIKFSIE